MRDDDEPGRLKRLARAVAGAAPSLASALGGPLAGAAAEAIGKAVLGDQKAPPDAVEAAVETAAPETLLALRQADLEFRLALERARLEGERIAASDRADARARQIATQDRMPAMLGMGVIGGFFATLAVMLLAELPENAGPVFSIMLGALATMTAAVVNYYFGSSAGSREKTGLLSRPH
jgi:hypothetical protein